MTVIELIIIAVGVIIYIFLWTNDISDISNVGYRNIDPVKFKYRQSVKLLIFIMFVTLASIGILIINDMERQLEEQSKGCPEYEKIDAYILKEKQ